MKLIRSLFAFGSLASVATALSKADFEFPDTVPLEKRQTEGPAFECHNDCGLAIRGGRDDGYCDSKEWRDYLNGCLDCALEFDIWRYYGRLADIAKECGIDATPKPVSGGGETSSALSEPKPTTLQTTTSAAAETTTEEASSSAAQATTTQESSVDNGAPTSAESAITTSSASVGQESSAAAGQETTSAAEQESSAVASHESSAATPSTSAAGAVTTSVPSDAPATPTPTPVSEGSHMIHASFLAAGVAFIMALGLM